MSHNELINELRSALRGTTAERYADRILDFVRPAVGLELCASEPSDVVSSRLGGVPDVPSDWSWPVGPEGPLRFLAQVELTELAGFAAASKLPPSGVLSFFFGPELYGPSSRDDYRIARVFHFPAENLRRASTETDVVLHPDFDLEPEEFLDVPTDLYHLSIAPLYKEIPKDLHERIACDLIDAGATSGAMQLLGYPSREQRYFLQMECHAYMQGYNSRTMNEMPEEQRGNANGWDLLGQFYLAWDEVWPDGNDGFLHFWIRNQDLANSDFSEIGYTWERS